MKIRLITPLYRFGVYEEFGPQNAYQRALADEVVDYLWWCSRCKRVEAGLLTGESSDQIGGIQPLMQLIKYLHEVSDKQFHEMLALYRYFNNSSGEFEADPPVGNSPESRKHLTWCDPSLKAWARATMVTPRSTAKATTSNRMETQP